MTVTVVYGKATDGYLHSYDASYATALAGPGDGVNGGNAAFLGQNKQTLYQAFQAFIGFDYTLIPDTEIVTHACIRLSIGSMKTPSVDRHLEMRGFAWSASSLQTSDWRTQAQLNAARLDASVHILSGVDGKFIYGTTDEFITNMRINTTMDEVLVTSRQRLGTTPTQDETVWFSTTDESGTTYDPAMIYTSAPRSTLFGVMGAQVETSLGHAFLESNGAVSPTITLKHRTFAGTVTTIGTIPIGTTATDFYTPQGAQALALVKDATDNLYVIGRSGNTENNLTARAYSTAMGSGTWTAQTVRTAALPSYNSGINQVVGCWHNVGGGSIFFVAGHVGSVGDSVLHRELQHGTINTVYLLTGSGSFFRTSGYSAPTLQPNLTSTTHFNTWSNETGTGLDVASMGEVSGSEQWGFLSSFVSGSIPGENPSIRPGRYILNTAGNSLDHASWASPPYDLWARKDAAGKIRVVPVSATAVAVLGGDSDAGFGLTVRVYSYSGSDANPVYLGGSFLSAEVPNISDGPTISQSAAWDAIYNETENRLWVYFVSTANTLQILRTAFDLSTMQAVENNVLVYTAAASTTIQAIRVQRGAPAGQSTLVTAALLNGTTRSTAYTLDTFNIAPTAPTLTPKSNFDATTAQTFAWTFNDPNLPTDSQSAYQLEISNASTGVVALDTGKVTSTTASRNVAGGTIPNGADYRWRVRTYDALDEVSPWSDFGLFSTSAGGTVTITSPASDFPPELITDDLPIAWSTSGTTQAAYRVWLYRGATLVSDTNWIASVATTHTVTGMLSDQDHEIRVRVRNGAAVETNTASRFVLPSFATPEIPAIAVTPYPDGGFILVTVDNPAPGAPALGTSEEDFESGLGTWAGYANSSPAPGSLTVDTTYFHHGTQSARLTISSGGLTQAYARPAGTFAVVAGERYTARMWVRASATRDVSAAIDWLNSSASYLSTSIQAWPVSAGEWYRIEVTGTAPETGFATFGPTIPTPANGEYVSIDEAVLTIASDRPDVAENEILRREFGSTGTWEVVGTADPDGEFRDYTATAGVTYEYRARGQA